MPQAFRITETDENYQGAQPVPEELFIEGRPEAETWESLKIGVSGDLRAGVWVGQPGRINVPFYPSDEIFTVISGGVSLHDAAGSRLDIGPGESCFVPKGWVGIWETRGITRKYFMVCNG